MASTSKDNDETAEIEALKEGWKQFKSYVSEIIEREKTSKDGPVGIVIKKIKREMKKMIQEEDEEHTEDDDSETTDDETSSSEEESNTRKKKKKLRKVKNEPKQSEDEISDDAGKRSIKKS